MKKNILSLLSLLCACTLLFSLCLCGCGENKTETKEDSSIEETLLEENPSDTPEPPKAEKPAFKSEASNPRPSVKTDSTNSELESTADSIPTVPNSEPVFTPEPAPEYVPEPAPAPEPVPEPTPAPHVHTWEDVSEWIETGEYNEEQVLVEEAYDEQIKIGDQDVCNGCGMGLSGMDAMSMAEHLAQCKPGSYHNEPIYQTIHHDAEYETVRTPI